MFRLFATESFWSAVGLGLLMCCQSLVAPVGVANAADSDLPAVEGLLKLPPRPTRPALSASTLPLDFIASERIALIGNSTAERMNLFGHFETRLMFRFAEKELVLRNFARPADEVSIRQRGSDYYKLDDPLLAFGPDTFFCFFGFNESFAGPSGVDKFKADYERMIDEFTKKYPRDDAGSPARFVLFSPIAFESAGDGFLPDGQSQRENLKLYNEAVREVADKRKLAFVDILGATQKAFDAQPGLQLTINGCHVNEDGDRLVAELLDEAMFGVGGIVPNSDLYERVRQAINDKSWVHLQDHRMLNGWYVYGGRRTWDTETFPREYVKIRNMAAVRDRYIWDLVQAKPVSTHPDDSGTGQLYTPATRFGEPRQAYSENAEGGPTILPPDDLIKTCTVPEGFEIKLFADESQFPEIAKPVQMAFDNRGRLWVSTMPSYPQWKPGDERPSDKLVILEDTNGDGKADKSTIFYDKLHCPTGFEFFNGGVLVVDQPRLIWLKDNDGDDVADEVIHVLDGWATEDTHHTVGAFESSPAGLLHMMEGVAMSTTVETPWGPFRNYGSSGCYVLDPRTWKIRHYVTPGYGNPWCFVFNQWGQGFCGDGTGANQHWDTPLSGAQYQGRKGINAVFNTEGMRPVVGSEFLVSRHFPDEVQGQFIYACVINMNGIPRWTFSDDGGGYKGVRVRHNPNDPKTPFDLIKSTDKHFRPVDPKIGPDGALWFGDWANPLIGHMQYSQRDPNRDKVHGRIYRLVHSDKPLLTPVTQFDRTPAELLDQLAGESAYEWRTRERVRSELRGRDQREVLSAVKSWVGNLAGDTPELERLRLEALWIQQSFHEVDSDLLDSALKSQSFDARAAATRVLADSVDRVPDAIDKLIAAAADAHPRVSTEAIRGLSFVPTLQATQGVLVGLTLHPDDNYVRYTAEAALGANLKVWQTAYIAGQLTDSGTVAAQVLDNVIALDKKGSQAVPHLQTLLGSTPKSDEERNKAMTALADLKGGNAENGKAVFRRGCVACHKVFNEGADFGPDMKNVGTRLTRFKLVESIIDPNAEIDPKYQSTSILTSDGQVITGLLLGETDDAVVIFDGKEKRTIPTDDIEQQQKLKQSSMPEGLAATISPSEFLDLIEFLSSLK
jgi:putative heme-binding domain-containing protein